MSGLVNLINSDTVVNFATILSLVLAIVFFAYQEYKQNKHENIEEARLKEEIVNLIIRNHVNSDVPISRVDLFSLVEGFQLLKKCKLKYSLDKIINMVYAKVYENDHIQNEARIKFLQELESTHIGIQIELAQMTGERQEKRKFLISSVLSMSMVLLLFYLLLTLISRFDEYAILPKIVQISIITIPVFILIISKPIIDNAFNYLIESTIRMFINVLGVNYQQCDKEIDIESTTNNIEYNNFKEEKDYKDIDETIFFDSKEMVLKVFEQRLIFEKMIKRLYYKKYKENTIFSVSRIISLLLREEVIHIELANYLKKVYSMDSFVVHEGNLPDKISSYEELISLNKKAVANIQYLLDAYGKN